MASGTIVTKCFSRCFHLHAHKTVGMARVRRKMKTAIHRLHRRKARVCLRKGWEPKEIFPVSSWDIF